jgi:hypothetical protein
VINRASLLDSQLADQTGRWLWPLYVSISRTDPFIERGLSAHLYPFTPRSQVFATHGVRSVGPPFTFWNRQETG